MGPLSLRAFQRSNQLQSRAVHSQGRGTDFAGQEGRGRLSPSAVGRNAPPVIAMPGWEKEGLGETPRFALPHRKKGWGGFEPPHPAPRALHRIAGSVHSSSVEMSPSGMPKARARSTRRMIFPERVLGSLSTKWMVSGRAIGPMRLATYWRTSSASASLGV